LWLPSKQQHIQHNSQAVDVNLNCDAFLSQKQKKKVLSLNLTSPLTQWSTEFNGSFFYLKKRLLG